MKTVGRAKKIIIIAAVCLLTIALILGVSAYFLLLHRYAGTQKVYEWSSSDAFDITAIKTVEKQSGKDFVILNLADVQMCDLEDIPNFSVIHDEITYLVELTSPDLITLTGDQTWSNENLISLKTLVGWLDGYKIPYAPIFGNHDHGNEFSSAVAGLNKCCDIYEQGKYSLFERGPTNIGALGNYVVNVTESGSVIKTLYIMDSGYLDALTDGQIEWLKWNAEGIKSANGGNYAEGICFLHKPLPEYAAAYRDYLSGAVATEKVCDVQVHFSLAGSRQVGFFQAAKGVGVTDFVCGHQHGNNFTLKYDGARLSFALKTGELGSYYADENVYLNGATAIRISGGVTTIENYFVPPERLVALGEDGRRRREEGELALPLRIRGRWLGLRLRRLDRGGLCRSAGVLLRGRRGRCLLLAHRVCPFLS